MNWTEAAVSFAGKGTDLGGNSFDALSKGPNHPYVNTSIEFVNVLSKKYMFSAICKAAFFTDMVLYADGKNPVVDVFPKDAGGGCENKVEFENWLSEKLEALHERTKPEAEMLVRDIHISSLMATEPVFFVTLLKLGTTGPTTLSQLLMRPMLLNTNIKINNVRDKGWRGGGKSKRLG
jgi:hypothetical protein